MGFMQSPDTLALKYKVPMWSEEHWKLMERSFALLGQIGCDEVYIPAICKTHLGNEHGMIRWIKQDDGSYQYDYSIAERYLDLALKHLGKPPVVCLYVWEYNTGFGWHAPENDPKFNKKQEESATISILDPKTGALSHGPAPFWGAPESKAFWKPVLDGMREILKKRGLEKSLMLGLAGDARPPRIAEADFKEIAPDVKWALHSHPYQEKLWAQPLGLGAFVWGAKVLKPPDATELKCGWKGTKSGMIYCDFRRGGLTPGSQSVLVRTCMEASIASGMNGLSRMGADFWEVNMGGRHPMILTNRYGVQPGAIDLGTCGAPSWFSPGKNGPVSSRAFELLREGVQECEGRIFIEKILTNPALSPKLGAELEKRCREVLAERVNMMLGKPPATPADWHRVSEALFVLAGEAATKVGAQPPAKEGDKP
jgi:hypothetical protein